MLSLNVSGIYAVTIIRSIFKETKISIGALMDLKTSYFEAKERLEQALFSNLGYYCDYVNHISDGMIMSN